MAMVERAEMDVVVLVGVPLYCARSVRLWLAGCDQAGALIISSAEQKAKGKRPCHMPMRKDSSGMPMRKDSSGTPGRGGEARRQTYGISEGVSGLEGGCGMLMSIGCDDCDMATVMRRRNGGCLSSRRWRCLFVEMDLFFFLQIIAGLFRDQRCSCRYVKLGGRGARRSDGRKLREYLVSVEMCRDDLVPEL